MFYLKVFQCVLIFLSIYLISCGQPQISRTANTTPIQVGSSQTPAQTEIPQQDSNERASKVNLDMSAADGETNIVSRHESDLAHLPSDRSDNEENTESSKPVHQTVKIVDLVVAYTDCYLPFCTPDVQSVQETGVAIGNEFTLALWDPHINGWDSCVPRIRLKLLSIGTDSFNSDIIAKEQANREWQELDPPEYLAVNDGLCLDWDSFCMDALYRYCLHITSVAGIMHVRIKVEGESTMPPPPSF